MIQAYNSLIFLAKIEVLKDNLDLYPFFAVGQYFPSWHPSCENDYIVIDYGDSTVEQIQLVGNNKRAPSHHYAKGNYTIRVYGNMILNSSALRLLYSSDSSLINSQYLKIEYFYINTKCFSKEDIRDSSNQPPRINLYDKDSISILDFEGDSNYIITPNSPNLDSLPVCPMPRSNEKFLVDVISKTTAEGVNVSTNRDYRETSGNMPFDDTGAAHCIVNKLEGKTLAIERTDSAEVAYTYSINSGKVVDKVLISGTGYYGSSDVARRYRYFDRVSFNTSTNTLALKNGTEISSGDIKSDIGNLFFKFIYTDGTFDTDWCHIEAWDWTCFLKGTKITLWDGSYKAVEDITYNDLLLVYDFIQGKLTYSYPLFLTNGKTYTSRLEITLENDEIFNIVGDHGLYDCKHKKLEWIDSSNYNEDYIKDMEVFYRDSDNNLIPTKIKSVNLIKEEVEFYTVITAGTQTCFTNNILSIGNKWWGLIGKIKDNHQFDLTNLNYVKNHPEIHYNYNKFVDEFGYISKPIYYGSFYDILYGGLSLDIDLSPYTREDINYGTAAGLRYFWTMAKDFEKDPNTDKNIYSVSFIYKKGKVESTKVLADELIELPETETGWYSVVDTNVYKEKSIIHVGTVFEEL